MEDTIAGDNAMISFCFSVTKNILLFSDLDLNYDFVALIIGVYG